MVSTTPSNRPTLARDVNGGSPDREQGVAAVAAARAADHALLGGAFPPARQGRAPRRVSLDRPAFEDLLLAEPVAGLGQDVVHRGPGLHEEEADGVGSHPVVAAVGVEEDGTSLAPDGVFGIRDNTSRPH